MKKAIKLLMLAIVVAMTFVACKSNSSESSSKISSDDKYVGDNFSISYMPADLDALCEVEKTDHSITIYDKESIEKGYPGMVIGIYIYWDPGNWSTGPFEKVGEIKINGLQYDVVLLYATESQFGFDTMEMPENYKKLYDARYEIVKNVVGKNGEKNGEKIEFGKGMKGEELYPEVLKKYQTAIDEEWDSQKLEDENMSPMLNVMRATGLNVKESLGYVYKDVNVDGIDELLIGDIETNVIYDIYTMVNRYPQHVVSGWDRNRYYECNSFFVNEYSNGANESGAIVYNLIPNSTELFFQLGYKYDAYENEENPYFISYNESAGDIIWDNVDVDRYREISNRFSDYIKIDYKKFSTFSG